MDSVLPAITGIYQLTGLPEMAGAFKFEANGFFEFFYSYGAVDRFADGTYTVEGNTIRLQSSKEPGKDFTIIREEKNGGNCRITIKKKDRLLQSAVRALVLHGNKQDWFTANNQGVIQPEAPAHAKIYLQHEFFPDVVTMIRDEHNENNEFTVTLNACLPKVSFKGIDLTLEDDTLRMPTNYFMPFKDIRFVKTGAA